MNTNDMQFPENHQDIVDRFVAVCQADERIVAAFLGASYARDAADQFSELDLHFITTDEAYEDFLAERESFVHLLGESLFLEDFDKTNGYSIIYSNGTEAEIWFGQESKSKDIHEGPYRGLLDKKDVLAGELFSQHVADPAKQMETLRHQINSFWHDLSHLFKAYGKQATLVCVW